MQAEQNWTIRAAVYADWMAIAEFNSQLALETEGKRLEPETIESGVRALLSDTRHGRYFVACIGDLLVGQMMHTREWSDWRNGEIWWLQSVYVSREHRRSGIFRALYQHLEQLAERDPGVVGIRLYVERENRKAIKAYNSLGLVDAHYSVMEKIFTKS